MSPKKSVFLHFSSLDLNLTVFILIMMNPAIPLHMMKTIHRFLRQIIILINVFTVLMTFILPDIYFKIMDTMEICSFPKVEIQMTAQRNVQGLLFFKINPAPNGSCQVMPTQPNYSAPSRRNYN